MIVHIAGLDVQVGRVTRQRCAWCGAVLVDMDTARVAIPDGQEWNGPPVWEVGSLVAQDGGITWSIEHEDGAPLPDEACGRRYESVEQPVTVTLPRRRVTFTRHAIAEALRVSSQFDREQEVELRQADIAMSEAMR